MPSHPDEASILVLGNRNVLGAAQLIKNARLLIEEFSQTLDCGLNDISKSDDFNQVFD